jgi:hypothetical protein
MTRTEERLADALDAAARALHEDTLRPLLVPDRPRRRPALAAPLAAAAAMLLVVGVGVAVARYLPGSGPSPGAVPAPPRYYVEAQLNGNPPVVRSTATGGVTARVLVPDAANLPGPYLVTAAANGTFFAAVLGQSGELIYRFRLSAAGQVRGLSPVPLGVLMGGQWQAGAMAASPDGSQLAVALTPTSSAISASCGSSGACTDLFPVQNDQIDVINTGTGARSLWHGGTGRGYTFNVISLSWTRDGKELAFYGQWCPQGSASTSTACLLGTATGGAKAEVWALNPSSGGGPLTSGRRLFRVPATVPDLPQAWISPDGSTITAVVFTGPATRAAASSRPKELAVERISLATGKRLSVLYARDLGRTSGAKNSPEYLAFVTLSADGSGRHWMLSATFCTSRCSGGLNGWIDGGQFMPLQPADGSVVSEAW